MLKFMRKKTVSVWKKDSRTLIAHGVLDDDIYGIELDVSVNIEDLRISAIEGKWNRWTTPECPRAIPELQRAVGFLIAEPDFSQKAHKVIGRKACRHFANLLLECSHSLREAALLGEWEDRKAAGEEARLGDITAEKAAPPPPPQSPPSAPRAAPVESAACPDEERGIDDKSRVLSADSPGLVIDLHVHTSPASPCSSVPAAEVIEEAKRIGLDGICLTDHNYVWTAPEVAALREEHGFLVLRGNEITTDQGDMLVFGLEEDIKGIIRLEELRKKVLQAGAFVIVAHPFRGFLTFGVGQLGLTPEKAMERSLFQHVDAVEVMNGKVTAKENQFAAEVASGLDLPVTGGSDAHEVSEVGVYATRFYETIRDEKDLIRALRGGNYVPLAYRKEKGF
ncbi:MAG: PHP domain-containing protein [Deltaproteobacteria bacterium]|nr:PHP domain-containing protein [Deltaproteobacteria bacterium]MBW2104074.1 PHP domain-containing protein [Deltaproteobacteria bacterium]MBW2348084.1 PHP domain-containing protein [Deltaproteobacteria bacterium]